jgi:hypothetical protein
MASQRIKNNESLVPDHVNISDIIPFLDRGTDQDDYRIRYLREIMGILLDSTETVPASLSLNRGVLVAEANHRSLAMLQLLLLLKRASHKYSGREKCYVSKYDNAIRLANIYRSLYARYEFDLVPCEAAIHGVINGLITVFDVTSGFVDLKIYTRSLNLKTSKRRALVLLISTLVVEMLKDGAKRVVCGRLALSFSPIKTKQISINIETSCPISESLSSPGYGIVCALSGVLDSEILYGEGKTGGTYVELLIPLES